MAPPSFPGALSPSALHRPRTHAPPSRRRRPLLGARHAPPRACGGAWRGPIRCIPTATTRLQVRTACVVSSRSRPGQLGVLGELIGGESGLQERTHLHQLLHALRNALPGGWTDWPALGVSCVSSATSRRHRRRRCSQWSQCSIGVHYYRDRCTQCYGAWCCWRCWGDKQVRDRPATGVQRARRLPHLINAPITAGASTKELMGYMEGSQRRVACKGGGFFNGVEASFNNYGGFKEKVILGLRLRCSTCAGASSGHERRWRAGRRRGRRCARRRSRCCVRARLGARGRPLPRPTPTACTPPRAGERWTSNTAARCRTATALGQTLTPGPC